MNLRFRCCRPGTCCGVPSPLSGDAGLHQTRMGTHGHTVIWGGAECSCLLPAFRPRLQKSARWGVRSNSASSVRATHSSPTVQDARRPLLLLGLEVSQPPTIRGRQGAKFEGATFISRRMAAPQKIRPTHTSASVLVCDSFMCPGISPSPRTPTSVPRPSAHVGTGSFSCTTLVATLRMCACCSGDVRPANMPRWLCAKIRCRHDVLSRPCLVQCPDGLAPLLLR